jgi:hypothetical protein
MKRVGRIAGLGVAAALALPAAAGGYPNTTPGNHDFGPQAIGTASDAVSYMISAKCNSGQMVPGGPIVCFAPGGEAPFVPHVTVTGPFKIQDNTCSAPLLQDSPIPSTCTFGVAFVPQAVGEANGIVDVGDPVGFGKAAVKGTGIQPTAPTLSTTKKKCKKKGHKRSAAAAKKKCRKKKR